MRIHNRDFSTPLRSHFYLSLQLQLEDTLDPLSQPTYLLSSAVFTHPVCCGVGKARVRREAVGGRREKELVLLTAE